MMWWGWHGWGAGLMILLMLVFWGGIIGLIVWVVTRLTRQGTHSGGEKQNPLDIARERYARGEINKEQFEQIRKDLSG